MDLLQWAQLSPSARFVAPQGKQLKKRQKILDRQRKWEKEMAEGTLGLEVEQEVQDDALHGAEADICCNVWKRPLFSEVTAAAFPSATKTVPCSSSSFPATEENKGINLLQSAVDIQYC